MAVTDPSPPRPATARAVLWTLGAVASFTTLTVAGREAGLILDTFEIMTYRSVIGLVIVVAVAIATGRTGEVRVNRLGLHLVRNLLHFFGQNLWFYALTAIPLALVVALEFSYPVWVAAAAPFVLGERLTPRKLTVVLLGFLGILVILRPGMIPLSAGTAAALLCAIGFAGSALTTKRLTTDQSTLCILFWLSAMQGVMGLACAALDGEVAVPTAAGWPAVIAVAVAGLVAHFCLTKALSLAQATVVAPIEFLRLPTIALAGAVIYGERPDLALFVGAALILVAIALNLQGTRDKSVADTAS